MRLQALPQKLPVALKQQHPTKEKIIFMLPAARFLNTTLPLLSDAVALMPLVIFAVTPASASLFSASLTKQLKLFCAKRLPESNNNPESIMPVIFILLFLVRF